VQASIRAAEEQVRFNELAVETQSETIRLNVATDYYNLQQADEQVRIAQSAVQNSEASLRDAEALERAGVGTRFDVLRSQVNLANAQQDLTNARSQQAISRRQLATRISLPQGINISAADPVQLAGLWNPTLEQSIVLAFQNRPELQQQLAQRNISEQQRRQALAELGPQVSLVGSYNLLDQFDDSVSVTDGYSLGVRATINLYDGGAARARAAQSSVNIAIAETQFAEQRNQIRFQVEQAYSTQQSSLENVQTSNTALEQAREALRLARLRFQAGVGTQTDVINSENDLTRAEGNRVTAILDYNRALAQLQRSVTLRALR
jgi:OMF family outer membrane factor